MTAVQAIKKNGETEAKTEESIQIVSFVVGKEEFGVDILKVSEINRSVEVTRVPNTPEYIEGVINLRGKVIPIIDLRQRFGMPRKQHDKNTRIIVAQLEDKVVGFVVDAVRQVLRIPKNVLEPPPAIIATIEAEYITAVGKLDQRLLILLDLDKVLSTSEKDDLKTLA